MGCGVQQHLDSLNTRIIEVLLKNPKTNMCDLARCAGSCNNLVYALGDLADCLQVAADRGEALNDGRFVLKLDLHGAQRTLSERGGLAPRCPQTSTPALTCSQGSEELCPATAILIRQLVEHPVFLALFISLGALHLSEVPHPRRVFACALKSNQCIFCRVKHRLPAMAF